MGHSKCRSFNRGQIVGVIGESSADNVEDEYSSDSECILDVDSFKHDGSELLFSSSLSNNGIAAFVEINVFS